MATFEGKLEKACKDLKFPGAILVAGSADGKFRYEKAFGVRSLKTNEQLSIDAVFWIASCTKLLTIIAAMQCVERGQIGLEDDVTTILPELKGREILKGFEEGTGKPILVPSTKTITLRLLLTHQSGISYDCFNPILMQYRTYYNRKFGFKDSFNTRTIPEAADMPLLFEPGEGWEYGVGIDLAGEIVSRLNNITLGAYLEKNIFKPLGMENLSFHPLSSPEIVEKLATLSQRDTGITMFGTAEDPSAKVLHTDETVWDLETKADYGGSGGYGPPLEYQKLLHSLCANDGKVLQPTTVDLLFLPQLTEAGLLSFAEKRSIPAINDIFGGVPLDVPANWSIGGFLNEAACPGRSEGSLSWGGYPNLAWWIDRKAGLSGILGTQILPLGDRKVVELFHEWTEEIYKRAGV